MSSKISILDPIRFVDRLPTPPSPIQNFNSPDFLTLANPQQFNTLMMQAIQINITEALAFLTPDNYLEISLPTIGMTDFLACKDSISDSMNFASLLAINGWGGGSSRPDFVKVTDIIGNQYELMVGPIEIPAEGIGLFSMITNITLFYSGEQILKGRGLQPLEAQNNMLYCLAPPNTERSFFINISVDGSYEKSCQFIVKPTENKSDDLTRFSKQCLLRNLFSEYDFTRCLLSTTAAQDFYISHENNFNDFLLSPEAIGPFYNLLLNAVINQKIPSDIILSKIPNERIKNLDLSYAPLTKKERAIVDQIKKGEILISDILKPAANRVHTTPQETSPTIPQRSFKP